MIHGQETCASFLEQVDLPNILRNIAVDYLPTTCQKTCASLSSRMCPNRAFGQESLRKFSST